VIGALRHRVELLTLSRVDDDGGGVAVSWLVGPMIWARVERLTSTRDVTGDRTHRLKRIAVTIRYRAGVVLAQQIKFDNEAYEVVSIESDETRDRQLTLICEEGVS